MPAAYSLFGDVQNSIDEIREEFRRNGIDSELPATDDNNSSQFNQPWNRPSTNNQLNLSYNGGNNNNNNNNLSPSNILLPLQQMYLQNFWNSNFTDNRILESILYKQLLEMQANNLAFNNLASGANKDSNAAATFTDFRPRECGFCKSNKETREFYMSHYLKTPEGHVVCPILSKYVCPYCKATGIYAHTKGYCPQKPENENSVYSKLRNDKFLDIISKNKIF